jgi:site-specific recombinase XerD
MDPAVVSLLRDASDFLNIDGLSANTVKSYLADLRRFIHWLPVKSWDSVTPELLQQYIGESTGRAITARRVVVLRMFFSWMKYERRIETNPALGLQDPRWKTSRKQNIHLTWAARNWPALKL